MTKYLLHRFFILLFALTVGMMSTGLSGCSEDSSDSSAPDVGSGELVISLTDAAGDFQSYTVDVMVLTLTKANGVLVHALPMSTRVDFAQYTDMTEFLTAASIPSGMYTQASLTLDYQNADIWVEDQAGNVVPVETIVDEQGSAVTTLEVSVQLENRSGLLIVPGIPAHLTLDFDLQASNYVTFDSGGDPALTVKPVLLAEVNPELPKIHRVRGPLKSVNVDDMSFKVIVRPFYHYIAVNREHERFGALEVMTDSGTFYDINGDLYKGQAGLVALDEMPTYSAVVAIGSLKFRPYRFVAEEVYAGDSVPGGDKDVVTGNVISRQDNTLVVQGATLMRTDGSVSFNDQATITLSENTVVTRQLSAVTYTIDDISVGQRLTVFGALSGNETTEFLLDASEGYVRMLVTSLQGTVVATDEQPEDSVSLIMDLQSIDARRIGLFDFSGTGIDEAHDADPNHYEINTGTLDLSGLAVSTPVRIRGFVNVFGQAPADFNCLSAIDVSALSAMMRIDWFPASTDPFESLTEAGLTLNLEGSGHFHHVIQGHVAIDLSSLSLAPTIVPSGDGEGRFLIIKGKAVMLSTTFGIFVEALEKCLAQGQAVRDIYSTGSFDQASVTLTSSYVIVRLHSGAQDQGPDM